MKRTASLARKEWGLPNDAVPVGHRILRSLHGTSAGSSGKVGGISVTGPSGLLKSSPKGEGFSPVAEWDNSGKTG